MRLAAAVHLLHTQGHFNPRTPCGVRRQSRIYIFGQYHFNPRTPCGVRPLQHRIDEMQRYFNPRTPCGVRLHPVQHGRRQHVEFQSTHPVRGATQPSALQFHRSSHFNPRTPCGVRPHVMPMFCPSPADFNPRTPCGVRQRVRFLAVGCLQISIHAPRAGCDRSSASAWKTAVRFQSTHPVRGATSPRQHRMPTIRFQSTHPVRGATSSMTSGGRSSTFQSTHPVRGATTVAICAIWGSILFQSTHPVRGATRRKRRSNRRRNISIHAPRAGCDNRYALRIRL